MYSISNEHQTNSLSPKVVPYVLRANGGELLQLKIAFTVVFLGVIYMCAAMRFSYVLLVVYALALVLFYLWAHSIKFTITSEEVLFKIGIAPIQILRLDEINEITMGFHPYGLNKSNMLVIHSIHPSKKDIKINYFLLFRRKDLAIALKTLLELNPRIQTNQKTIEFLSDKSYSPY